MFRRISFLNHLIILIVLTSCNSNREKTAGKIFHDDLNRTISFSQVPKRVITLAPNLTEFFYSLGLGNKIVANTTYCNYPPQAKLKEKVGDLISLNFEKILSLKPDLIFITVEGNSKSNFSRLLDLGLNVFVSNPRNYKGIKKTLTDIASIFGREKAARRLIAQWDSTVNRVYKLSRKRNALKTMFVVSLSPLMLAGKNTFINSFLQICNLQNIASAAPSNYPIFNREKILQINPEVILLPEGMTKNIKVDLLAAYPEWRGLNAIKGNKIFLLPPDLFLRPGPRFVQAVKYLFQKIEGSQNGSQ